MESQESKLSTSYPAMLKLQNKRCVIVGSGKVALRKLHSLGQAGARITVVAPDFSPEFQEAAAIYEAQLVQDNYESSYLQNSFLTIAATDSFAVNRDITLHAPGLCNNITEPELGNFIVPASFQQGNITIAVSTDGIPAYTRQLKAYLQTAITPVHAEFLEFLRLQRQELKTILPTPKERTMFWRQTLTPEILELLASGNLAGAKEKVLDAVTSFRTKP